MFILAALLIASTACGDLCTPEAIGCYARLNALAASNRRESERAAFLVRTGDRLDTVSWQIGEPTRATYRGRIPAGTVAVVHTHPIVSPQPSAVDVSEAQRLGLPVLVITPARVVAAMPEGQVVTLFGAGWNAPPSRVRSPRKQAGRGHRAEHDGGSDRIAPRRGEVLRR